MKRLTSTAGRVVACLLMAFLLTLAALPATVARAATGICGYYVATSCIKDGEAYEHDGEYLELDYGGTGVINFNGDAYPVTWSYEGGVLACVEDDGYELEGAAIQDGTISGTFVGYAYTFELDPSVTSPVVVAGINDGASFDAPAAEAASGDSATDLNALVAAGPVTFPFSEGVMGDGTYEVGYAPYLVLNADGTGMTCFKGASFPFTWESDGRTLSARDTQGRDLVGTYENGTLAWTYQGYSMTATPGDDAPIMSLSPGTWFNGLGAFVHDTAQCLSDDQLAVLEERCGSLSRDHGIDVHLVVLSSIGDYTDSGSIYTVAEEIRCGYQLGQGDGHDCVALVVSPSDRKYDLISYGPHALDDVFYESAREKVADGFVPYLSDDDWYGAFCAYLDGVEDVMVRYERGTDLYRPLDGPLAVLHVVGGIAVCGLLGWLVAAAVCSVLKRGMKPVAEATEAGRYVVSEDVDIWVREDQFVRTDVSRVYDPPESDSDSSSSRSYTSSSGTGHTGGSF